MEPSNNNFLKKVVSHAKEYGFIFPSSEIYDGLSAVYDYGQNGVELKNNLKQYWWEAMTRMNNNIVGIDSAIFMHPTVWKASGHVDAFNDPMIDNKDSKKRYRADVLVEDHISKIEEKIEKEIKKLGDSFDKTKAPGPNSRIAEYQNQVDSINLQLKQVIEKNDMAGLKQLIVDLQISDPVSGTRNWTDVRQFNLMFSTEVGSLVESTDKIFLRPETAQGIFVNFLNVQKTSRMKVPFGIAQIGKAFRNEIVARQFIFRMREFEQMEMQFFVVPNTELKWFEWWKEKRMQWHVALGLGEDNYRYYDHRNLAHYANAACDIQYKFPMGFKELEGIHSRTDFDLKNHEKYSGKKLQYFDSESNQSYLPYVVETSIGLDRLFLAVLSSAYKEEKIDEDNSRVVLSLPPALAPQQVAILPLLKNVDLARIAESIIQDLKFDFRCSFDDKGTIGKRYRKMDAIGTPYCVTIDHQTLEDKTVTIRNRDTMEQDRITIAEIKSYLEKNCSMRELLRKLDI